MHNVLDQPVDRADLRDHEWGILGFDSKHNSHLELHRKAILGYHLERIKRVRDFARSPLDRLVRCRNDDWRDGKSIDVVAPRSDYHLLDASKAGRHHVGFVSALIEPFVRGIT